MTERRTPAQEAVLLSARRMVGDALSRLVTVDDDCTGKKLARFVDLTARMLNTAASLLENVEIEDTP